MGRLTDYNPLQRTWWISDKERRHGLAARTVIIPSTTAEQVDLYLDHLRELAKRFRFQEPRLAERCERAIDGSENLLFAFTYEPTSASTPCDLTPLLLEELLGNHQPWARNWSRHHLRSELVMRGILPELIDGWMGHEDIGEEALGKHSFLSMTNFKLIANTIETILNEHKIGAIPGWQTH
jgi:hypothetical protein